MANLTVVDIMYRLYREAVREPYWRVCEGSHAGCLYLEGADQEVISTLHVTCSSFALSKFSVAVDYTNSIPLESGIRLIKLLGTAGFEFLTPREPWFKQETAHGCFYGKQAPEWFHKMGELNDPEQFYECFMSMDYTQFGIISDTSWVREHFEKVGYIDPEAIMDQIQEDSRSVDVVSLDFLCKLSYAEDCRISDRVEAIRLLGLLGEGVVHPLSVSPVVGWGLRNHSDQIRRSALKAAWSASLFPVLSEVQAIAEKDPVPSLRELAERVLPILVRAEEEYEVRCSE